MPVWKLWFALCFAIPFLILFPVFYIALRTKKFDLVFKMKRFWARIISIFSFLYPQVKYVPRRHRFPHPCVVVSNHTSYLDIVFSPFYVEDTAVYMGKSELLMIPLFKYFFMYFDIPVKRKSVTDSHRAFKKAGDKLDEGISVIIYPEGTINDKGVLRPFKNGAFKLAIEKQVPVLPVVNLNNWHFLENGGFFKANGRPGIPRIVVGEPISTKGMTNENIVELRDKVFNFTKHELDKFNDEENRHKNS